MGKHARTERERERENQNEEEDRKAEIHLEEQTLVLYCTPTTITRDSLPFAMTILAFASPCN